MADNELRNLFSANLRRWLEARGKTQSDMRRYMGVSSATASDWCNGKKIPRADKIQSLCTWLGIELDDLLKDKETTAEPSPYYLNPETAALAQELFDRLDLRVLMDAARDVSPESVRKLAETIQLMKQTNPDG